jgi:two-component system CheB/CheR fusion protein
MARKKQPTKGANSPSKRKPPERTIRPPESAEEVPADPADPDPVESNPEREGPPVVGIGASAGGLDAFKRFFAAMPADSGITFVLIPHLDPEHKSLMVELLARHTSMPVAEAANGMAVRPNHVYIIPPDKYMTIQGGTLRLTGPVERHTAQTSIDLFLRSLADDQQERAICIILSGTGSHGSLGLKAVKAQGGMALVQDPATARYNQMPASAVATGLADQVLPVEQMPEALVKYVRHAYIDGGTPDPLDRPPTSPVEDHLPKVLALLQARAGFDFRCYRKQMLRRRIERRLVLNQIDSIHDYVAFLRDHPEELRQLARDLLISVTSFFRDPEAFQHLASDIVAPLVRGKEAGGVIRVWVPGCATGEEPYSIAMLLLEELAAAPKNCRVQIFATDVEEDAIQTARRGIYPDSIAADVSPERLARFFTRTDEHSYQVNKQLRETLTFAVQNLIGDAPFSRLDLISCRNLLIYLEPEVQKKVITLFHFALNDGGYLFLGPSETIGRRSDLFEPLSKQWRLYRRIGPRWPRSADSPIAASEARGTEPRPAREAGSYPINLGELTQRLLLEQFAPAAVLINRKHEILYHFGPCAQYLEFPAGEPTHDLIQMARDGLRTKLQGAIRGAVRTDERVVLTDVRVRRDGDDYPVRVTVLPVPITKPLERERSGPPGEGMLLITFEEEAPIPAARPHPAEAEAGEEPGLRQLQDELNATREDLQSTIEELESSNEELTASNEEIMSMNEELQSTNEELKTSRESLQSLNEELSTLNTQLQDKVRELKKASNDIANLLDCTEIATVFLDRAFGIKLFTPAAARLFHFTDSDVGRPLADIAHRFSDPEMIADAREVLQQLAPREAEVSTADGSWWARRITPYLTRDHRIDGVVITFVNVTERKQAADAVVRRLAAVVESSADAIFSKDLDGTIRTWNRGAERLYGYSRDEIVGRSVETLIPGDRGAEWSTIMTRLRQGESVEQLETERVRKGGERVAVALTVSPIRDSNGSVVSASVIARDITDRKRAEEALRESEERLRRMMENAHVGIAFGDSQGRIVQANRTMLELVGWSEEDLHAGRLNCQALCRPEDSDRDRWAMSQLAAVGRVGPAEKILIGTDGTETPVLISAFRLEGNRQENVTFIVDLRPQKQAEQALRDRETRLQAILDTAADAIITIDHRGIIQSVNSAAVRMFGYSAAEMIGQKVNLLMASPHREAHDGYLARYLQTGEKHVIGISREVDARRKDGSIFPTDLAVTEIEHLKLFTGIHRDLTERKQLERDVVEAASLEQRRIGQDLHDSVAQELTALNLLVRDLAETLQADPANALQLVERMVQGLRRSQRELRTILRGLLPVSVDTQGLMAALADLADRTQQEGKLNCTFDCPKLVVVADNLTATHLYLIAQEAVYNVVKHARAQNIRVTLADAEGCLVLSVQDDGIGMPIPPLDRLGLGLRIMRNRAAIIGATLTIEPAEPSGTLVMCVLRRRNHEPEEGDEARPGPDRR